MKTGENMAVVSETTATDLSNREGETAGQTIRTFSGQNTLRFAMLAGLLDLCRHRYAFSARSKALYSVGRETLKLRATAAYDKPSLSIVVLHACPLKAHRDDLFEVSHKLAPSMSKMTRRHRVVVSPSFTMEERQRFSTRYVEPRYQLRGHTVPTTPNRQSTAARAVELLAGRKR